MEKAAKAGLVVNPDIKVAFNGDKTRLVIDIPLETKAHPSRSGESYVVASTHGNLRTGLKYKRDAEILLQVNAVIDFEL